MAKFSQALLQGLLNPTYQQGLFEAARNVGQAPGIFGLQKKREERAQQFQAMNPLEQGQFMLKRASQSGDVRDMVAAQGMIDRATENQADALIQPLLTELSNPDTTDERVT